MPLADDVDIKRIASVSHGYVGADLEYLCKEAAMKCLRRLLPEINLDEEKLSNETLDKLIVNGDDYKKAIMEVTPSGIGICIILSNLPGLSKAGSIMSALFVAASTTTPCMSCIPSSSVNN